MTLRLASPSSHGPTSARHGIVAVMVMMAVAICMISLLLPSLPRVNGQAGGGSCGTGCQTCDASAFCTQCAGNLVLYNGTCSVTCPSLTVKNNDTRNCDDCSTNCLACSTATSCYSCAYPYVNYNNTCIDTCPSTHYNMSYTCYECSSNCTTCTDNIGCVECNSPLFLSNTSCLETCPSTTYGTSDRTCASCGTRCASCTSPTVCNECITGALYYNAACYATCPTTTFANLTTGLCSACGTNCATCYNATVCQYCTYPYVTYNGVCTTTCPIGYFANSARVCIPCGQDHCEYCTSTYTCTQCADPYYLQGGSCVTNCTTGYYAYGLLCPSCGSKGGNCSLAAHALTLNTSASIWYRAVTRTMDSMFRIQNFSSMPGVTPIIYATVTTTLAALWWPDDLQYEVELNQINVPTVSQVGRTPFRIQGTPDVVEAYLRNITYKVPYQPAQDYDTINITITQAIIPRTTCTETPVFIQTNTTTPGCKVTTVTTGTHTVCYQNISQTTGRRTTYVNVLSVNSTAACVYTCNNCTAGSLGVMTCGTGSCYDERYPVWNSSLFEPPVTNTTYISGPTIATAAVQLFIYPLLPPPEAPTVVSKTQTSITLAYGLPDVYVTLHRLPLLYTIEALVDGATNLSIITSDTTVTMTPLLPFFAYTFRVRATEGIGITEWSAFLNDSTTPYAPGTVTGLTASVVSTTQIYLDWDDVDNGGDYLYLQYNITWGTSLLAQRRTSLTSDFLIQGLTSGTTYIFTVLPVNSYGSGTPATVTVTASGTPPRPTQFQVSSAPSNTGTSFNPLLNYLDLSFASETNVAYTNITRSETVSEVSSVLGSQTTVANDAGWAADTIVYSNLTSSVSQTQLPPSGGYTTTVITTTIYNVTTIVITSTTITTTVMIHTYVNTTVTTVQPMTKASVDTMLTFSTSIGTDYTALWRTTKVLRITVVDATGHAITPGVTTVTLNAGSLLNNINGTATMICTTPSWPLIGYFFSVPAIADTLSGLSLAAAILPLDASELPAFNEDEATSLSTYSVRAVSASAQFTVTVSTATSAAGFFTTPLNLSVGGVANISANGTATTLTAWFKTLVYLPPLDFNGQVPFKMTIAPIDTGVVIMTNVGLFRVLEIPDAPILTSINSTFTSSINVLAAVPNLTVTDVDSLYYPSDRAPQLYRVDLQINYPGGLVAFSNFSSVFYSPSQTVAGVARSYAQFTGTADQITAAFATLWASFPLSAYSSSSTPYLTATMTHATAPDLYQQYQWTSVVDCIYSPAPTVLDIRLDDTGGTIRVKLDRPIVPATGYDTTCWPYVDLSINYYLGAITCSFVVDNTVMLIGLAAGSPVNPGDDTIAIPSPGFQTCPTSIYKSYTASGSPRIINFPQSPARPNIFITGPKMFGDCVGLSVTFVATATNTSGRVTTWSWSVPTSWSTAMVGVVIINNNLTITNAKAIPHGTHTISVTGTGQQFLLTGTAYHVVVKSSTLLPTMQYRDAPVKVIETTVRNSLRTNVTSCNSTTETLVFSWSVVGPSVTDDDLHSSTRYTPNLILPESMLVPGLTYNFTLTASVLGASSLTSTLTYTVIGAAPLTSAKVGGGSYREWDISNDITLTAVVTGSLAVSTSTPIYTWTCSYFDGYPCLDQTTGDELSLASSQTITIDAGDLSTGAYIFSLSVNNSGFFYTSQQTIVVYPSSYTVPTVSIDAPYWINTDSHFEMPATVSFTETDATLDYLWDSPDFKLGDTFYVTGETSSSLVANQPLFSLAFRHTHDYSFTLNVTQTVVNYSTATNETTTSYGVAIGTCFVNAPPSLGVLSIYPTTGISGTTVFTFSALTWVDPEGNLPLTFQFLYLDDDGTEMPFSAETELNTLVTTLLPPGLAANSYKRYFGLKVRDSQRSSSTYYLSTAIIVRPPVFVGTTLTGLNSSLASFFNLAKLAAQRTGATEDLYRTATIIAHVMNEKYSTATVTTAQIALALAVRRLIPATLITYFASVPPALAMNTFSLLMSNPSQADASMVGQAICLVKRSVTETVGVSDWLDYSMTETVMRLLSAIRAVLAVVAVPDTYIECDETASIDYLGSSSSSSSSSSSTGVASNYSSSSSSSTASRRLLAATPSDQLSVDFFAALTRLMRKLQVATLSSADSSSFEVTKADISLAIRRARVDASSLTLSLQYGSTYASAAAPLWRYFATSALTTGVNVSNTIYNTSVDTQAYVGLTFTNVTWVGVTFTNVAIHACTFLNVSFVNCVFVRCGVSSSPTFVTGNFSSTSLSGITFVDTLSYLTPEKLVDYRMVMITNPFIGTALVGPVVRFEATATDGSDAITAFGQSPIPAMVNISYDIDQCNAAVTLCTPQCVWIAENGTSFSDISMYQVPSNTTIGAYEDYIDTSLGIIGCVPSVAGGFISVRGEYTIITIPTNVQKIFYYYVLPPAGGVVLCVICLCVGLRIQLRIHAKEAAKRKALADKQRELREKNAKEQAAAAAAAKLAADKKAVEDRAAAFKLAQEEDKKKRDASLRKQEDDAKRAQELRRAKAELAHERALAAGRQVGLTGTGDDSNSPTGSAAPSANVSRSTSLEAIAGSGGTAQQQHQQHQAALQRVHSVAIPIVAGDGETEEDDGNDGDEDGEEGDDAEEGDDGDAEEGDDGEEEDTNADDDNNDDDGEGDEEEGEGDESANDDTAPIEVRIR